LLYPVFVLQWQIGACDMSDQYFEDKALKLHNEIGGTFDDYDFVKKDMIRIFKQIIRDQKYECARNVERFIVGSGNDILIDNLYDIMKCIKNADIIKRSEYLTNPDPLEGDYE
jgi:hypothetical protein